MGSEVAILFFFFMFRYRDYFGTHFPLRSGPERTGVVDSRPERIGKFSPHAGDVRAFIWSSSLFDDAAGLIHNQDCC